MTSSASAVSAGNWKLEMGARNGALFDSRTVTATVCVVDREGTPLSVATKRTLKTPGPSASVVVQVKAPFVESSTLAPGEFCADSVMACQGASGSLTPMLKATTSPS